MPSLHRMPGISRGNGSHFRAAAIASFVLLQGALAPSAGAAPPPPQSATTCFPGLADAPTTDQPNLMNYSFQCDGRITAYTIVATRLPRNFDVIESFSTTAVVLGAGGTIASDQSFGCEGTMPGNGINCNAGGGFMGSGNKAQGSFSLTDPYCKTLAPNAAPGTPAMPTAIVQLIVTDTGGAQDGPFRMSPSSACPAVPDRAPLPKKKTKKHHATHHGPRA